MLIIWSFATKRVRAIHTPRQGETARRVAVGTWSQSNGATTVTQDNRMLLIFLRTSLIIRMPHTKGALKSSYVRARDSSSGGPECLTDQLFKCAPAVFYEGFGPGSWQLVSRLIWLTHGRWRFQPWDRSSRGLGPSAGHGHAQTHCRRVSGQGESCRHGWLPR